LGRYLYYFDGVWVDLDERKQPKTALKLFGWATPEGWREGLRPQLIAGAHSGAAASASVDSGSSQDQQQPAKSAELVCQIEAFEKSLGKSLYRGLLKRVARVGRPSQIQDMALLRKLLAHLQGAERGLRRLETAVGITGPEALARILKSLKLDSMERIDNLETLKEIVLNLEEIAAAALCKATDC